jgi:putative nucleotidyltransferase with HDIG domain
VVNLLRSEGPVRVLVVDDDEDVREVLQQEFERRGIAAEGAASAAEARGLFGRGGRFHLVLCDIDMPGERGTELLAWLKATDPDVAVVMVTGISDAPTAVGAMLNGASDYVCKPFSLAEVRARTDQALDKRRLVLENRAYQTNLERLVEERTHEVLAAMAEIRSLSDDLRAAYDATLAAMLSALDKRDNETQGHSLRVVAYTERLARELGIGEPELTAIRRGALLHDVGKIGIRDEVLLKPGRLSPDERAVMESHAAIGHRIAVAIHGLSPTTLSCIRHHHERWDGEGYPDRLAGSDIPLGARIVSVVDVWDALSTARPYKPAFESDEVLGILRKDSGRHFDPEVVDVFFRILEDEGEELLALLGGAPGVRA